MEKIKLSSNHSKTAKIFIQLSWLLFLLFYGKRLKNVNFCGIFLKPIKGADNIKTGSLSEDSSPDQVASKPTN